MTGPIKDRDFALDANQSLAKALSIIEALSASQTDIGVRELGRQLSVPPSVVHRLLATLRNHGFVEQDPRTMRYRIGFGLFEAGQSYMSQRTLADSAFEELQQVSRDYEMAAYLGVIHDDQIVYILSLPDRSVPVNPQPGKRAHLHSTALGKVALTYFSDTDLKSMLSELPLPRLTYATITDPERLADEVHQARDTGWATCLEENIEGIFAFGVPVRNQRGEVIAGISLASQGRALFSRARDRACEELTEISARITARLNTPLPRPHSSVR
ncbi:IclR family transcriptional regulator [Amorphus sp. MBR-141]|jgi:DNA-binding IclR family transcriptional regulator